MCERGQKLAFANNEATDAAVPHNCNINYRLTINNAATGAAVPHWQPH